MEVFYYQCDISIDGENIFDDGILIKEYSAKSQTACASKATTIDKLTASVPSIRLHQLKGINKLGFKTVELLQLYWKI